MLEVFVRIAFTHNVQHTHSENEAEFDRPETVAAIAEALRELGHEVVPIEVSGSTSGVVARLEAMRPNLVFNTAEGSHGRFREGFWPGLFEQLGLPYTGSDAYVCTLTLDKRLSKMVVAQHGIPTPRGVFVDTLSVDTLSVDTLEGWRLPELRYPVIVKPNFEGSSKGITIDSIVEREEDLRQRVSAILEKYPEGVLIEEFIVGRDVVVPFLEQGSPATGGVLAPVVYRFAEGIIGQRKYDIYDYELKCVYSDAVEVECLASAPQALHEQLTTLSRQVFRILGVRDFGRIDWRLAPDGRLYFLELNALPSLEPGAGIYVAAAQAGLPAAKDVLGAILDSAVSRFGLTATMKPRSTAR